MGDVTVSTPETNIYYPSKWLIEGGPPFDMNCPLNDATSSMDDDDALMLNMRISAGRKIPTWRVVRQNRVLMESTNTLDIAGYFRQYMLELIEWTEMQGE